MKKILICIICLVCLLVTSCAYTDDIPYLEENEQQPSLQKDQDTFPGDKVEYEYKKISFVGAGDNIVYFGTVRDAQRSGTLGGRKYNFKPIYSEVKDIIEKADVSYINQETLMCGEGYDFSYYPYFNGPQDMGYDLVELGFDVVGIANNHMLDKGSKGLNKTIEFWDTLDVTLVGGYKDEADYNTIRVHEKDGIKIAFLAYTEMTNGNVPSKAYTTHIPYLNEANLEEQVAKAKEISDIVIVSVHWGDEGSFKPNNYQKNYAKKFADCGVDVVLGHHPHVIQPVEWIEGKDGNKMLCVYSLGNFMAEQAYSYNMVGGMISFDIVKENNTKARVENVVFIPTVFDWGAAFYDNRVYLLEEYTAQMASNHGIKSYGRTTSLKQLRGYVSNTIDDMFLSEKYKSAAN